MKKYYKRFDSKKDFYDAIGELCPTLDAKKSLELSQRSPLKVFWQAPTDTTKKTVRLANLKAFAGILNKIHGLSLIWPICFTQGNIIHIYSSEDIFKTEVSPIIPNVVNSVYTKGVEDITLDTEEVDEHNVTFSKQYANTLYDHNSVKKSKDALEAYGKLFGIDLKKNKSFDNMLKDLEKHVAESE